MHKPLLSLALAALLGGPALADTAPFDLAGPALRVSVTHGGQTLPIAEVPQLATGDGISVIADLPDDQSAHYVLIAAFLRGSTNPPPDKWFFDTETWTKKGRKGLSLTVPDGAQQVVLFLAPATGGDVSTLRNAVQGRPGAFVRAAQELAQASLDHGRLATYLDAVRRTEPDDPGRLARITPLLARSLQVKINADCLTKLPALQAACLLQNQESLVLNDGHSNAITDAVGGPGADLALQLSATPQGGLGYYSPYIAAIRDVIGIFSSIHTAKYQYIPALATLDGDHMGLLLNAPPSFHNPKSVLVTALPIVAPVHVPPLQLVDPSPSLCGQASTPLLPMDGAPLVYATRYAHDLSLRVALPDGRTVDLPATPDAEQGGLVIHVDGRLPAGFKTPLDATVHGIWGFQPFDGPKVTIQPSQGGQWRVPADAGSAHAGSITISGGASACVTGITTQANGAAPQPAKWNATSPTTLSVTLSAPPAKEGAARNGPLTIAIAGPAGSPTDRLTLSPPAPPEGMAVSLIAHAIQRPQAAPPVPITLGSDTEIPGDATFTFSLRADKGGRFTGKETVEIAADSGGGTATLSTASGLRLADRQVMLATIEPAKALGVSAFGPLRARIVRDGAAGDWIPLGTLVRLPRLRQLDCPSSPAPAPSAPASPAAPVPTPAQTCTLSGDDLFLIAAVSTTPGFEQPAEVPDGYPGTTIAIPHPANGALYLRLRDDPATVSKIGG
ncbi:hypothetical protein [Sphingomonas abietis]|uniref:Uncharacterized protein n=1 Tax=Sphingomonas abietis TaxID=3012344 RepID=A0ABY7NL10_9SPHN|nr:hypothetical protein [Sphingomonas abietis]WBO21932.1 hypothetical protein PBT88_17480 [Sphingomonas abietis]